MRSPAACIRATSTTVTRGLVPLALTVDASRCS
jgi:hypothetical protein